METFSYQMWFSVRYVHVLSVALLSGGAFLICALSASSAAITGPQPALMTAAVYERVFWLMAGVAVATGVSNLGLKGDGVLGPATAWGSALSVKLMLVAVLLALSLIRSECVVRWRVPTCPQRARARLVLIVLYPEPLRPCFSAPCGRAWVSLMAGIRPLCDLRVWSLATFRTTSFTVGVIILLHLRGSLAGSLHRLDTASGFGVFVVLWATTWLATRGGLRELENIAPIDVVSSGAIVISSIAAGGRNGLYLFGALMLVFVTVVIGAEGLHALQVLPVFVFGSMLGGIVAFTIGAVAGLLYGVFEMLMRGVCDGLYRWTTSSAAEVTSGR